MALPTRLTAMRSFTYNIEEIRDSWKDINGEEPSDDDILELVAEYYAEDLASPLSRTEITLVDPDTGDEY